jgi:hypothetical protein
MALTPGLDDMAANTVIAQERLIVETSYFDKLQMASSTGQLL